MIIAHICPLHSSNFRSQTHPRHLQSETLITSFFENSHKRILHFPDFLFFYLIHSCQKRAYDTVLCSYAADASDYFFIYAYSLVNYQLFKANRHPASIVLYIETEQDHIAVLYHIFFSFQSYQTFFTGCSQ